ncbi:probable prefoldin subunit 4 [Agrilus planipennis]|uniref:Probable prefoldin subunit 4 n=1 Tax=Agrilus planipennis TaxID=224129 RepID=A0A7F5RL86_AGRPL|nr:probable prefoldin subunit 4 [Agrilus planipennis]
MAFTVAGHCCIERPNDLKSLEDAVEEIALLDDDEKIAYLIGEVFIYQNTEKTQNCLDDAKKDIEKEIKDLTSESVGVTELMSDLKTHLYGKFGSSINLEADEE